MQPRATDELRGPDNQRNLLIKLRLTRNCPYLWNFVFKIGREGHEKTVWALSE